MIRKVTITGTESTGKTTLAEKLSAHYSTIHVPDYSRSYIGQLTRSYNRTDVLEIAREIIEQEDRLTPNANRILFSDNDLLNIKIWLQYYRWEVPAWLEEQIVLRKSPLYLLCDIDLPWVYDEQRENPLDRAELLEKFRAELNVLNANYVIIKGNNPELRLQSATQHIDLLITKYSG